MTVDGVYGAVLGYSHIYNKLLIIAGEYDIGSGSPPWRSNFVAAQNLTTDYILYDENHSPVDENTAITAYKFYVKSPNIISDRPLPQQDDYSLTTAFSCENQCATQINNLLYIVNPIGNTGIYPSELMAIFNVDTLEYIPQNAYTYNVPDASTYSDMDTGCVVNDGTNLYVLGNHASQPQNQFPYSCPDGEAARCPFTDLYAYYPATNTWTARDDLTRPNIYWRMNTGCAMSSDNQFIYIFGGVKRYLVSYYGVDVSIRETEKYNIATNTWTTLPVEANFPDARWSMFSFVSTTENNIYLYGGYRQDLTTAGFPGDQLDSKEMVVFDLDTESMLDLTIDPQWNVGQWLGLTNTMPVRDVCPYEIGIAVGSQDFVTRKYVNDIQMLRFLDTYSDGEIIVNPLTDMTQIFDAYKEHNFKFEIIVTTGALFIPDIAITNYDFLIKNWQGIEYDINGLQSVRKYKNNAGGVQIVTITQVSELDPGLFDRCYSSTNIIKRIEISVRIVGRDIENNPLCGQTRQRRLRKWFFRDSDPDNDDVYEYQSSVKLEIINPNDSMESVISQEFTLIHDCTI